jgi:hypothetical protein
MKLFAAFLGGFGLTLASFGGGVLLAITYFAAEPVQRPGPSADTAATWPNQPVRVEDTRGLQRLPDRPVSPEAPAQTQTAANGQSGAAAGETVEEAADAETPIEVDGMTTAAITGGAANSDDHSVTIMDAHVAWCAERYRSYRPGDNSYQPYGADGRAPCVSPYFGDEGGAQAGDRGDGAGAEYAVDEQPAQDGPVFIAETVDEGGGPVMTRDHIQSCFDRYRSYRPEDNTYQPYGGGPRQQCM